VSGQLSAIQSILQDNDDINKHHQVLRVHKIWGIPTHFIVQMDRDKQRYKHVQRDWDRLSQQI